MSAYDPHSGVFFTEKLFPKISCTNTSNCVMSSLERKTEAHSFINLGEKMRILTFAAIAVLILCGLKGNVVTAEAATVVAFSVTVTSTETAVGVYQ